MESKGQRWVRWVCEREEKDVDFVKGKEEMRPRMLKENEQK